MKIFRYFYPLITYLPNLLTYLPTYLLTYIANLAFHDLVMEIVQNSFIHN
jgi:hypothetical protein